MKTSEKTTRICPLCHAEYHGVPAMSRTDNATPICPDCGTRQALASLNVPTDEQEKIIGIIHRSAVNQE